MLLHVSIKQCFIKVVIERCIVRLGVLGHTWKAKTDRSLQVQGQGHYTERLSKNQTQINKKIIVIERKEVVNFDGCHLFSAIYLHFYHIYLLFICMEDLMHKPQHVCRGKGTTCKSQFFLSTMCLPGLELGSPTLSVSTFNN